MPISSDRIVQTIKGVAPANAEIKVVPGATIEVIVAWPLNNDPARPNKRSKTIRVCVSKEAADDFENASDAAKAAAYGRATKFLAEKFANFDPNHSASQHERPPEERWVIGTNALLG